MKHKIMSLNKECGSGVMLPGRSFLKNGPLFGEFW